MDSGHAAGHGWCLLLPHLSKLTSGLSDRMKSIEPFQLKLIAKLDYPGRAHPREATSSINAADVVLLRDTTEGASSPPASAAHWS